MQLYAVKMEIIFAQTRYTLVSHIPKFRINCLELIGGSSITAAKMLNSLSFVEVVKSRPQNLFKAFLNASVSFLYQAIAQFYWLQRAFFAHSQDDNQVQEFILKIMTHVGGILNTQTIPYQYITHNITKMHLPFSAQLAKPIKKTK